MDLWLSSTYINKGSKKNFLEVMASVQELVPEIEWPYIIMCGDWNIHAMDVTEEQEEQEAKKKKMEIVTKVCKQMGLNVITGGPTRKGAILDFIIDGNDIKIFEMRVVKCGSVSDHDILMFRMSVQAPDRSLRTFTLPDRKLADRFTLNSLRRATNSNDFLKCIQCRLKSRNMKVSLEIKRKPFKRELLDKLLFSSADDEDFAKIISEYWKEKAAENEANRFQGRMSEAFKFLRKIFKYHEYDRRDGSIIGKIKGEGGDVISDPREVNKKIIQHLKTIQTKEGESEYLTPLPFPRLDALSMKGMEEVISSLSTNKAIAYDGLSDVMFNREWKELTTYKLRDLWDTFAELQRVHLVHFEARLVPLNKVYTRLPSASDCRPIIITSSIVRLLELDNYMMKDLHCNQIGFVPHNGITVNHVRLLDRVNSRVKKGRRVFGLFLDFSNAYNTILHSKLFERLKKALSVEEINFIKAIYSRFKIKLGDESFSPNIGVS